MLKTLMIEGHMLEGDMLEGHMLERIMIEGYICTYVHMYCRRDKSLEGVVL
jgi:hypothetical protein